MKGGLGYRRESCERREGGGLAEKEEGKRRKREEDVLSDVFCEKGREKGQQQKGK